MSMEYYIYLKHTDNFSIQAFEQYCNSLNLRITIHPSFNLSEDSGFVPMRILDERFTENGENKAFLSGFELFSSDYHHISKPHKKIGLFKKFFERKSNEKTPFDKAIKNSTIQIELCCSSVDSLELLLAYVFGAYHVKHCDGIFYDPQIGQFYDDNKLLEKEITEIITELSQQAKSGELLTHEFKEWT